MKKFMILFLSLSIMISILFTACNTNKEDNGDEQTTTSKQESTETTIDEDVDPFGKYDPAIEITTVYISMDADVKFPEGESVDNNVWTRAYEEELGIKVKSLWAVPGSQSETKINLMISSDTLPDILPVFQDTFQELYEADKLADLTEAYDKYGSEFLKESLNGNAIKSVTRDGKIYAIPLFYDPNESTNLLWVRMDWLEKLGLPEPKTMDDVFEIAEAFVNEDPDGNNEMDTVGLGVDQDIWPRLQGFFNGFHAYPNAWIEDSSGKLVDGSVQSEMKNALKKLNELYEAGLIDKEFGSKDLSKIAEDMVSGKIGLIYGGLWEAWWPLQQLKDREPDADWKAYPLPSIDEKPAKVQVPGLVPYLTYVAKKDTAHPEAIVKMANLSLKLIFSEEGDFNKYGVDPETANSIFKYSVIYTEPTSKNYKVYLALKQAFETDDESSLDVEQKAYYDAINAYNDGDNSNWYVYRSYGLESSTSIIDYYTKNNLYLYDKFEGSPTPTMSEKASLFSKWLDEAVTDAIINGDMAAFDDYIELWTEQGGIQMTEEVNEWYKNK